MDLAGLVTVVTQLGFAYSAWRLASQLKLRVEEHDHRLVVLETVIAQATEAA